MNQPEFSDITFIVEEKPFYAHKIVVSLLSERFRIMLKAGLSESQSQQGPTIVKIDDLTYSIFTELMKYLYTGKFNALDNINDKRELLDISIEFLRVADVEVLDDVKIACEMKLIQLLTAKTFPMIQYAAEKYNADRLKDYCGWF